MNYQTDKEALWPKYFKQFFYPLEGEDLALWFSELERIPNLTDTEIIRAIRRMAEEKKPPKYPKIQNLTYHIRMVMKEDREKNTVSADPCGLCHPHAPGCLYQTVRTAKYPKPYDLFTPCPCSLGQAEARRWAKQSDRPEEEVFHFLLTRGQRIRDFRKDGHKSTDTMSL